MGFSDFLFGSSAKVTLPEPVKAQIAKLQYIPFGPERDELVNRIKQTYGLSSDLFDSELGNLGEYLQTSEDVMNRSIEQTGQLTNQLQAFAGYSPVSQQYENMAGREASYLQALKDANAAAFDPYGSIGSQFAQAQGLMSADAASRGVTTSGIARQQEMQNQMKFAQAKAEADSKAIQQARAQGVQEAQAYNQARQIAGGQLQAGVQAAASQGDLANRQVANRMAATQLYGNTANTLATQQAAHQSELRGSKQEVENYNTATKNKVYQDYANALNQRATMQASLDAQQRNPGLLDYITPIAGVAGSLLGGLGSFAGGLGSAAGTLGKVAQTAGNVVGAVSQATGSGGGGYNAPSYNPPAHYSGYRTDNTYNPGGSGYSNPWY